MKKQLIYTIGVAATLFTACENIAEDERFIAIEDNGTTEDTTSVAIPRVVLLEDYTGQGCMNCPNAHDIATGLHERYGERLVVVSMHAGSFGLAAPTGLKQTEGDTYATSAGVETYPSGVVNRRGGAIDYLAWGASVREEMQRETPLALTLNATVTNGQLTVQADMEAQEMLSGKLQLWLLEDSIVAFQRLPDGSVNAQYVHNHVFRAAINGTWGEEVALVADEETSVSVSDYTIDASWNTDNLSVVGFVYDGNGVIQAAQCKVNTGIDAE